jgi:hypothetical protein
MFRSAMEILGYSISATDGDLGEVEDLLATMPGVAEVA